MKTTKNLYRVPKKQWNHWSEAAKAVFNRVYDFVLENPHLMNHPKAEELKPMHWKTVAWNTGWIAADAVDDEIPTIVEDINMKTGKTVRLQAVRSAMH